jgi:hypothetical protein
MAIRTPFLAAAVPLGLLLAMSAWGQAATPRTDQPASSAPSSSPGPVHKPRIDQNQDIDSKNGAITPSTPGTSRTPGTPGATGTPDHPSGG